MSFSESRATICSEVRPSGIVHGMLHHLALDNGADDIAQTGVLLKRIFAGLQIGARLQREHAADKRPAIVVDHAFALENIGNIGHSGPGRNVDDLVFLQRARRLDLLLAVDIDAAGAEHHDQHDGDDRVAGDRPAGCGRAAERFGGGGTCSGSSAARGLRGEMGGLSLIDAT